MLVLTDTSIPPLGVADMLLGTTTDSVERFAFWLQSHNEPLAPRFWRTAVLRECLPDPECLRFGFEAYFLKG